jgi:hypothetical protein
MNDLLNKEKELHNKFQAATTDSKFADFLRKIYKKKYTQPKVRDPDGERSYYPWCSVCCYSAYNNCTDVILTQSGNLI